MRDETPGSTSETLLLGLAMFEVGSECCLARERGGIGPLRDWVEVEFLGDMFEVLVALKGNWFGVGCRGEEARMTPKSFCSRKVNVLSANVRKEQKVSAPSSPVKAISPCSSLQLPHPSNETRSGVSLAKGTTIPREAVSFYRKLGALCFSVFCSESDIEDKKQKQFQNVLVVGKCIV